MLHEHRIAGGGRRGGTASQYLASLCRTCPSASVHTGQQDISLEELRKLWRHCDENGFDWISVWDHFYEAPNRNNEGPTYEPVALMAALAVETRNVRIGCLVFCMNYRNPALLAKSMTTIDHLSGGRVTVGLGAGWHVQEHEAYGYNFPPVKERLDRLVEGTRIIRGMTTREHSTFEGKYYRTANIANNPMPVQSRLPAGRQGLPIIIGGGGEQRTLRIAARRADGWNVPYIGADVFAHKAKVLDTWCEKQGRDPATIEKSVNVHFLMSSKGGGADTSRLPAGRQGLRPGAVAGGVSGEPQQVIDRIGEYIEGGARRVNIAIRPPVDWDALQEYIEDVMPAFR